MPRLTVRSLAELMQLPGYEQYRILYEQKHPRSSPGAFKAPYYAPALRGIRSYYADGNSPAAIEDARSRLASIGNLARRSHNERVLTSFAASPQADRFLMPVRVPRLETTLGDVDLHLAFDLVARENDQPRWLLYNMRVMPVDEQLARATLEVAHWLLQSCGVDAPMAQLEYVDLAVDGQFYSFRRTRSTTIKQAEQTLKLVETLWPTI
jgi:hypothetical protein